MMSNTARTDSGSSSTTEGSNSIPTDTKNNTANASFSGSESAAARWLKSDSLSTTPAKNAPSASETSNSSAEPYAIPRAIASTARVNSSPEPVRLTRVSNHGTKRVPTTKASATKTATLTSTTKIAVATSRPSSGCATTGRITTTSTIATSSTISQPIATLPS